MICTECGASNREGARFCRHCQAPLPAVACPHCGAPLRSTARFCKKCGQPVTQELDSPPDEPPGGEIVCPRCGLRNRSGARFCRGCSQALDALATLPPISKPTGPVFRTGGLSPEMVLLDRYKIIDKIAQGGMGAIYKALDLRLQDRVVAVKEMSESVIAAEEREHILAAFKREAQLLARLSHRNMVRVTDRFEQGDRMYTVMEYVNGRTLAALLSGRVEPFSEDIVLDWARQLCDVLAFLHSQEPKIIYRDMKPANVMVVEGTSQVKLIDFGIARFYKPGQKKDTIEFGTGGYAPPEQYGEAQTDARSDIYALGVMLHQLLTLHDPASTLFNFPDVRALNPGVSRETAAAIATALQNQPEKRFASAAAFREALPAPPEPEFAPLPEIPPPPPTVEGELPPLTLRLDAPTGPLDLGEVVVRPGVRRFTLPLELPDDAAPLMLKSEAPWLRVLPETVAPGTGEVTLEVDTGHLETGRLSLPGRGLKRWIGWHTRRLIPAQQAFQASLAVAFSGGQQHIPVRMTAVPHTWRVQAGWGLTISALIFEGILLASAVLFLLLLLT